MKLYLSLSCLLLSACASLPQSMSDAHVEDISYSQATQSIENYKNIPVRWGGTIIDVENEEDFSLVQVLFYPLNYSGRPQPVKQNEGRFVIKTNEFLDPVVYSKDKEITVVGILHGKIERMVGKKIIHVPLIDSSDIHLWPNRQNNYYGYGMYGGFGPYYHGFYGRPFLYHGRWGRFYRPYWY